MYDCFSINLVWRGLTLGTSTEQFFCVGDRFPGAAIIINSPCVEAWSKSYALDVEKATKEPKKNNVTCWATFVLKHCLSGKEFFQMPLRIQLCHNEVDDSLCDEESLVTKQHIKL